MKALLWLVLLIPQLLWSMDLEGGGEGEPVEDESDSDDDGTTPEESGGSEKTFTQKDLNRILKERLDRAKESGVKDVLAALEVEDLETLKSSLTEFREIKDSERTELERAQERLERLESERDQLIAEKEQIAEEYLNSQRIQALRNASEEASDPEDVVLWAQSTRPEDFLNLVNEDGSIDPKDVTKLVAACKEAKPHYFNKKKSPGSPSNNDGKVPGVDRERDKDARGRAMSRTKKWI